jgi:triacylglycerol lipase
MPSRSTLARLQQAIVCGLLVLAAAWLAWQWSASPLKACVGAVVLVFGYSIVLAAEFVLLKLAGGEPDVPQPSWGEILRAWWAETVAAARVFYWRQPFRWRALPDSLEPGGKRGVVLVHGFVCNRGLWNPWMQRLRREGCPYMAVNLEPVFGSIDAYAPIIEDAVRQIFAATGHAPVIVCHSMGGLAVRAWLRTTSRAVAHVVTIASPHRGTWLGRFSHTANGRQMRLDGDWVAALAAHAPAVPFTCWYSNCDNIVFPASTSMLPGADNRLVRGAAHVELAFRPEVMDETLRLLTAS